MVNMTLTEVLKSQRGYYGEVMMPLEKAERGVV
jgi:hypothetical protein